MHDRGWQRIRQSTYHVHRNLMQMKFLRRQLSKVTGRGTTHNEDIFFAVKAVIYHDVVWGQPKVTCHSNFKIE
ncbi:hypothetical protein VTN31DRAFT_3409 [Thermomyces dupontii]|uniref:uncharacterized protein n=1 Tax=Talaromyces thermophilus TaxID=28565 RepID=UPI003743B087